MSAKRLATFRRPPPAMVVEPHSYCNLSCLSCLTGQKSLPRPRGRMSLSQFTTLVDEVAPRLKVVHWSGMCEPLLFEDCLDYLRYLADAGVRVRVDTNGHCFRNREFVEALVETGTSEVNVAFDGVDQATLAAIRGPQADFEGLVAGTRLLIDARDRLGSALKVNLQFIVSRPNENRIREAQVLGRSLRPDSMTIKAIRLDPHDSRACAALMPQSTVYRSYQRSASGNWRLKGSMLRQCWAIREFCVLWWDGTLVPCCFDLAGEFAFGNAFRTSFAEAWNSDAAARFRLRASTDLPSIPLCASCPVGRREINCWPVDLERDEGAGP